MSKDDLLELYGQEGILSPKSPIAAALATYSENLGNFELYKCIKANQIDIISESAKYEFPKQFLQLMNALYIFSHGLHTLIGEAPTWKGTDTELLNKKLRVADGLAKPVELEPAHIFELDIKSARETLKEAGSKIDSDASKTKSTISEAEQFLARLELIQKPVKPLIDAAKAAKAAK
jgi:hypothetical protein